MHRPGPTRFCNGTRQYGCVTGIAYSGDECPIMMNVQWFRVNNHAQHINTCKYYPPGGHASPRVPLALTTLNSVSPFSPDSSLSLRTCFPLMKNVSGTLAQRKAPWKISARCMFFGGVASGEARRDPSIRMNATVNKLELG